MNSSEVYTVVGFYATIIGTILGVVSLIITIYISSSTKKIRNSLINNHRKQKFKKTKETLLTKLGAAYKLIREDAILDKGLIEEILIEISQYNNILQPATRRKMKNLKRKVGLSDTIFVSNSQIASLIYEISLRIDAEVDEYEEYIRGVVK